MLALIGALVALAWLSLPEDEPATTDSSLDTWTTARGFRPRQPGAGRKR